MNKNRIALCFVCVALLACGLVVTPAFGKDVEIQAAAGAVTWRVNAANIGTILVVRGQDGFVLRRSFEAGQAPYLQLPGDGAYKWQLVVQPALSEAQKAELRALRSRGEEQPASAGIVESGYFSVLGGVVSIAAGDVDQGWGDADIPTRDQVIADDLIVQGSACVGFDCVNGESFGFDTIRLKENSTRIKFDDTSATAGFPANDWQLTANDSASGGQNKFSIEDITGAKVPFTVEAGAATNALYVDSTARVGFRTSTPVLDLHISTSNSPGLRLEQTAAGGFTAQTWDIVGNEANFFVRDVTGGSRLPLRIRPGAPTSSIDINASGFVGIGTASPTKKLHIKLGAATNDTAFLVENNEAVRFDLSNNSTVNGGVAATWFFQADSDANRTLKISKEGSGGTEVTINNRQDVNGVTFKVDGSVMATNVVFSSSRELKESFAQLDPQEILNRVVTQLPVSRWRFKEGSKAEHIGPMAEDFHAAFGLDSDDKTISMTDTSGVALAAIQGLNLQLVELSKRLVDLEKQNADLKRSLESLAGQEP